MYLAISAAAALAIKSITKAANGPKETVRILSSAIRPAFGIRWSRGVIRAATTDVTNRLLQKSLVNIMYKH